ncbi:50S ribosomal protein L20 [Candidatus Campbellbacteria bacterium]|nr:50S ribosomal protein L20 [Candidatus Campbellbacteria bacterium]|tara:strand:+ start:267 stop:611 length:345 start_codon:yes stop_codon:yes gene_type:complete
MPRVKRGTIKNKSRKNTLAQVKGYRFGRSKKKRQATEAIAHAGQHAFAHRRDKKSNFRRLWNIKINAEVRKHGLTYSTFMDAVNKKGIKLNRKMLADLAENAPESFKRVVDAVK